MQEISVDDLPVPASGSQSRVGMWQCGAHGPGDMHPTLHAMAQEIAPKRKRLRGSTIPKLIGRLSSQRSVINTSSTQLASWRAPWSWGTFIIDDHWSQRHTHVILPILILAMGTDSHYDKHESEFTLYSTVGNRVLIPVDRIDHVTFRSITKLRIGVAFSPMFPAYLRRFVPPAKQDAPGRFAE